MNGCDIIDLKALLLYVYSKITLGFHTFIKIRILILTRNFIRVFALKFNTTSYSSKKARKLAEYWLEDSKGIIERLKLVEEMLHVFSNVSGE